MVVEILKFKDAKGMGFTQKKAMAAAVLLTLQYANLKDLDDTVGSAQDVAIGVGMRTAGVLYGVAERNIDLGGMFRNFAIKYTKSFSLSHVHALFSGWALPIAMNVLLIFMALDCWRQGMPGLGEFREQAKRWYAMQDGDLDAIKADFGAYLDQANKDLSKI